MKEILEKNYKQNITDEFLPPILVNPNGIIKENEIEFINDYVEKNNLRANFALPNYEIPELTKYRKFRLNYDLVENYKAQDENLLIEFCQKNKIRITR